MMMTNETMEILESKLRECQRTREDYFAQIKEQLHAFRLALRSRDKKEENPEDQTRNDEEWVETEVATEPIEIEQGAVRNEANAMMISAIDKEDPISQLQVPDSKLEPSLRFRNASPDVCEDFKSLVGFDGLFDHVQARNELVTKLTSVTNSQVAHQLFDEIPLRKRILPKERKKRFHKCWRFKFKDTTQPRGLIQEKLCVHEANETMNQLMLPMDLGRHILHQQLEINLCEYKNQILQLSNHDLETQMLLCLQRFSVVRIWDKDSPEVDITDAYYVLQVVFEMVKELSYWSVDNHVKRDAQERFGYNLIVAFMENKKTGTKLKVKKHDYLSWKEDESRSICWILKLGGVAITCKNVLEKIYDKNLEIVACRLRPAMMESSVPSKVIGRDGSKRHGRSEVSCDVDYLGDHESSSFRESVVASTVKKRLFLVLCLYSSSAE